MFEERKHRRDLEGRFAGSGMRVESRGDAGPAAAAGPVVDPAVADTLEEFAFGGPGGSGSLQLNAALRGQTPMTPAAGDLHRRMQAIMADAPPHVPTDPRSTVATRAWRVVSGDKKLRQRLVAMARKRETWVEPGYSSTTTDRDTAMDFAQGDDDVLLQVAVVRGALGVVDLSAAVGDREGVYDQKELLLDAGTRFELSHPERLPDGTWRILATVSPPR